jgi:hypothetical protein
MNTLAKLNSWAGTVEGEYFELYRVRAETADVELTAAINIQRLWRAHKVTSHMSHTLDSIHAQIASIPRMDSICCFARTWFAIEALIK